MSLLANILKAVRPLVPDSLVNRLEREYFNHRWHKFGTMTTLQIDSTNHRASFELELRGETQPLRVSIGHYELTVANGKTFLEIHEVTTSREWMTLLAQQLVKGKKFEGPEMVASVL
jgi:hypothetical protein